MALSRSEQLRLIEEMRGAGSASPQRALERLLDDFRPAAMAVIGRTLGAAGVGQEHADEAWDRAVFKFYAVGIASFAQRAAPRTYFCRVALHAAVDVVRTVLRRPPGTTVLAELAEDPSQGPTPDQRMDTLRAVTALRRCLEQLPEGQAKPVRLYYLDEAGSCATCAEQLGIGRDAFMKRLERARAWLARCLGRAMDRPSTKGGGG